MKKLFFVLIAITLILASAGCISTDSGSLSITNSDGTVTELLGKADRIALLNSNAGEDYLPAW